MAKRMDRRLPEDTRCVVLGIDPGSEECGAAIRAPQTSTEPSLRMFGSVKTWDRSQRAIVVRDARKIALALGVPLVLAAETWPARGLRMSSVASLNEAVGAWRETWCEDPDLDPRAFVRVLASSWRLHTLGAGGGHDSEAWKRLAIDACRVRYGCPGPTDHNTAEAALIAEWAIRSEKVAAIVKRVARAQARAA